MSQSNERLKKILERRTNEVDNTRVIKVQESCKKLQEHTSTDQLNTIKAELKKKVIKGWTISFSYPRTQELTLKISKLPKADFEDLLYETKPIRSHTLTKADYANSGEVIKIYFPATSQDFEKKAKERLAVYLDPKSKNFGKLVELVCTAGMFNYNNSNAQADYSDSSDTVTLILGKDEFTQPILV